MLKYSTIFILSTLLFFVKSDHKFGPKYPPTRGEVWPKPKTQKSEDSYYKFDIDKLEVHVIGQKCKILKNAIERYFFVEETEFLPKLETEYITSLEVNVKQPCGDDDYPYFGMDESCECPKWVNYESTLLTPSTECRMCNTEWLPMLILSDDLTVKSTVKLDSPAVWGAIRGLETLVQMFYLTDELEMIIKKTVISDAPRYLHRGLLIDTSRHYISRNNILKTIDAMAMNKMNVLHWHIVDDPSFPYQSEKFPNLSLLGAYHSTLIYTKDDIETLVKYARDRGIRIVPEIDVPGHTRSWGEAYPNILSSCYEDGKFVDLGPMNPVVSDTYKLLRELFSEVQDWFPDKYFHIGGDEVGSSCWLSDPVIRKYMEDHDIKTTAELLAIFMGEVVPLLKRETIPIVWQEVFDQKVPLSNNTLIQVWKYKAIEEMKKILDAGHLVLFSAAWYLDTIHADIDWDTFYKADPRNMVKEYFEGDNSYILENIVGGEACMWGEAVDDANIISRVWPRASAVAERLWSPAIPIDEIPMEVYHRLEEHACRMKRRGVDAQPPHGPGFCIIVV